MLNVRLATTNDIPELIQMRWDFTLEDYKVSDDVTYSEFETTCGEFLKRAITGGDWFIWVGEMDGNIVSHMYLQLIHKVPRPAQSPDPYFGYVTNVYTRPNYRGQRIGTEIHKALEQWSKDNYIEFLILWPSSSSVDFYARNGFSASEEALEKHW